jgi:hypothetical protein
VAIVTRTARIVPGRIRGSMWTSEVD